MGDTTTAEQSSVDGEAKDKALKQEALKEDQRIREILSNVYVFVRSQALNRVISSYTLDHYLVQAQEALGSRSIKEADGTVVDRRPSKLQLLDTLEDSFKKAFPALLEKAKAYDEANPEEESDS